MPACECPDCRRLAHAGRGAGERTQARSLRQGTAYRVNACFAVANLSKYRSHPAERPVSAPTQQSLLPDIRNDATKAEACAANIRSDALKQPAQAFAKNVRNVSSLILLPQLLASAGPLVQVFMVGIHGLAAQLRAPEKAQIPLTAPELEEFVRNNQPMLKQLADTIGQPQNLGYLRALGEQAIQVAWAEPGARAAFRLLLTFATSGLWTAFECVASDAWISAVNARPTRLGQRGLKAEPAREQPEGIKGKSIEIGLLARHGYDLRACLGTVLESKFDFTGVAGIRNAYSTVFGDEQSLKEALNNDELGFLEVCRHVITHSAGVIDREQNGTEKEPARRSRWVPN